MAISQVASLRASEPRGRRRARCELDAIRQDIEESLGAHDAAYIRRTIRFQRALESAARLLIAGSRSRTGWALGTASLAFAKSIENMELGHNICHGQWDWMNDPEIHSNTWEWDMAGCRRNGVTPTTIGTTCSPTSSVWTTTSATASCG